MRKYLQFFHLSLDADTVQMLRAVRQLCKAPLSGTQPLTEGRAEAIRILDTPQLLLQLLDGVLRKRRIQKVRQYRFRVTFSKNNREVAQVQCSTVCFEKSI